MIQNLGKLIIIIGMSQVPIYLRKANGICMKMPINLTTPLHTFYSAASVVLRLLTTDFILYYQGNGLNKQDSTTTLRQLDLRANAIIDVLDIDEENPAQLSIFVQFGGNLNSICINELEPFSSIHQRIAEIISMPEDKFQMFLRNSLITNQDKVTPYDFHLKEKEIINIKCKMAEIKQPSLASKVRQVESVASSSDKKQQSKASPTYLDDLGEKSWNLKKKNSCTFSMKKINQYDEAIKNIKKSAIESTRFHFDLINNQRKGLTQITDIKQTMSFGSLQSAKKDQFCIVLVNEYKTKQYKFSCVPECTAWQIRKKLAKLERVNQNQLIIDQIDDNDQVGQFLEWADQESVPTLIYRILTQLE